MESEKLTLGRENPCSNPNPNPRVVPAMAGESQKSPAATGSVLERFKALLRQRDDDLRVSADDAVSAPRTEEIVQLYELVLSELTFNSKPIITDLTIVAGEQRDHAKGIAEAICARVLEVSVEQKLPSLYLLDSIVKNIGREYIRHFSSRLPEVFCEAYRQVHPSQHGSMRHLFGTWTTVFPQHVLDKIEAQLQFSPPVNQPSSRLPPLRASESPRQIHVNPKYVRKFDHPAADSHIQPTGGESALKLYAQKPAVGVIDRDDEMNKWQRKPYHNQNHRDTPASYRLRNGRERQGPRALIDAYGTDDRVSTSSDRPLRIERLDSNGMDHRSSTMLWQNSDEEEFNWEAMSPTLVDHSRSDNFLPSSISSLRNFKSRPDHGASRGTIVESDIRNRWSGPGQVSTADESSTEDSISSFSFGRGSAGNISQFQSETNRNMVSRHPQEPWNITQHHSQLPQHLNPRGRVATFQVPSGGDNLPPFMPPDADNQLHLPGTAVSRIVSSSVDSINVEAQPVVVPSPGGLMPPVPLNNSHTLPLRPMLPMQNQKGQYDFINPGNTVNNQGPNKLFYTPGQLLDRFENKEVSSARLPKLPNQTAFVAPINQQNQMQTTLRPRLLSTHGTQGSFLPSVTAPVPQLVIPNLDSGYAQGHASAVSVGLSNPVLPSQMNLATGNMPNTSLRSTGGGFPPLPPGPPPLLSSQNAGPVVSGQHPDVKYSVLISSLMAHGLISLTKPNPVQEPVGLDFNVDLLKVRHESAINALYGDLQRQCTTCGLRFKCQEEHRSHMDWHVTKNRMSKNRKQKPSRKWFVSASMWLSGAEALGAEAVPGFLPTETVAEKKSDEEMAVPADEDQNACALCGEPFEEFYSDENEEWMYRGAVYMNAPEGLVSGMDKSHLGPIVHAKCRSESSVVPPQRFGQDEGGPFEEGSQRKRLRS